MYISLAIVLVVAASLPLALARPWLGVLVWSWIGYMAPHKLAGWGFAANLPLALIVGLATLLGMLLTKGHRRLPVTRETWLLGALLVVFTLSTVFSLFPGLAWPHWFQVLKIFVLTFVTLLLFQDRQRLRWLLLVIVLSYGFYAVKGAVFTVLTGGQYRVMMPESSALGSNNGLGLALNVILGLLVYLAKEEAHPWMRRFLQGCAVAAVVCVIFTYSRGAFLGLVAVLLCLVLKSRRRVAMLTAAVLLAGVSMVIVPDKWMARIESIENYEEDGSARGRLDAWLVCLRLAEDRPLLGGGFWAPSTEEVTFRYNPDAVKARNAHSIYFNVLGEHGVTGFVLFVGLIGSAILSTRRLRRPRRGVAPPRWVVSYAHGLELGLIGYAVNGAFLSVAYVELFYHLIAGVILLTVLAARETGSRPASPAAPRPPAMRRLPVPAGPPPLELTHVRDRGRR